MSKSFTRKSITTTSKCNIYIERTSKNTTRKHDSSVDFKQNSKELPTKNKNARINKDLEKINIINISPRNQDDFLILDDTLEEPSKCPPTITQTERDSSINYYFSEKENPNTSKYASCTYESRVNECKSIFEPDSSNSIPSSPEKNRKTTLSKWVERRESSQFSDELKALRSSKDAPVSYSKNDYQRKSNSHYTQGCKERIGQVLYSIDNYQEVFKNI